MALVRNDATQILQTTRMLKGVWKLVLILGIYSCIPVAKEYSAFSKFADFPSEVFGIFGAVLSVILVFRTNRAYDRWWEGRIHWGKLVNISRNLAIKINRFAGLSHDEQVEVHRTIAGFPYALRDHLRKEAELQKVPRWEHEPAKPDHVPGWLTDNLYQQIKTFIDEKRLTDSEHRAIDNDAIELLNVCGACERIRNTPIAGSYRSFAIKCLTLYLLTLPWGLVQDLNYMSILVTMIVAYIMIGLEAIASSIEEPFGRDLDDLDLDSLCQTIDRTTGELLDVPQE